MKRCAVTMLALLILLSLSGCSLLFEPPTMVRFANRTSDAVISYGIRVGDVSRYGELRAGETTAYKELTPGEYAIELLNASAIWSEQTELTSYGGGNRYTVGIIGSIDTSIIFFREVDD